jgi:hypothetical protein
MHAHTFRREESKLLIYFDFHLVNVCDDGFSALVMQLFWDGNTQTFDCTCGEKLVSVWRIMACLILMVVQTCKVRPVKVIYD